MTKALDRITEMAESALDPEMTREDLVRQMKDIANFASGDDEPDEEEEQNQD